MIATPARIGMLGVDVNTVISASDAKALADHGYAFVLRYVPRLVQHPNDLTGAEIDAIKGAGLGLMIVQHVEAEGAWVPTLAKGASYGSYAAKRCTVLGIGQGTSVWLDLEGVAPGTDHEQVIKYCNAWHDNVLAAGFTPGLYVGYHCGLTADELYHRLWFNRYWSAYNLNGDEFPAIRGVCLHQRAAKKDDYPSGIGYQIDVDVVTADALGGLPMLDVPEGPVPGLS